MKKIPKSKHSEIITNAHYYNIIPETREIFLTGYEDNVEQEPGVDYRMAAKFERNLRLLENMNPGPILIHMHSIGGEWADGMAIYDAIKSYPYDATILAYAHARSMTSIIFQAAKHRVMMPNAYFMIHYGSISMDCNDISAQSMMEFDKLNSVVMLQIYADKCSSGPYFIKKKMKQDKIKKFLDKKMCKKQEWYISSEDAVYYGFADGVLGDKKFPNIESLKK